mmetsp:Transcript_4376/g.8618  ORF Transcript_4376/g.8618 Transcript_4376/m.8618 type:complete len:200 (-) Transcript_4376:42-641(-)
MIRLGRILQTSTGRWSVRWNDGFRPTLMVSGLRSTGVSRFRSSLVGNEGAKGDEDSVPLMNTQTHANLKSAFVAKCMAVVRAKYFEQIAEVEGDFEAAMAFQAAGQSSLAHALATMDTLEECGDPATDAEIGDSDLNLSMMSQSMRDEGDRILPEFAQVARNENLHDIAEWLDRSAAGSRRAADNLEQAMPLEMGDQGQ